VRHPVIVGVGEWLHPSWHQKRSDLLEVAVGVATVAVVPNVDHHDCWVQCFLEMVEEVQKCVWQLAKLSDGMLLVAQTADELAK